MQLGFLIGVKEKLRIGKTWAYDFGITFGDRFFVFALDIGDHDKFILQFALRINDMKIALIITHRRDQTFLRHIEKTRFKFADDSDRPFD